MRAAITHYGMLDVQVCIPKGWSDEQVRAFAEEKYSCGTTGGWQIRREGSELLSGSPERAQCEERRSFVHIMLDA